jgi:prevent-host-death family protein
MRGWKDSKSQSTKEPGHIPRFFLVAVFDSQSLVRYNLDSLDRRWPMIHTWQLQDAKNKLSRVVENAVNEGPQIITKHGVEVAIVMSYAEYQKMIASRGKLSTFFQESPLVDIELDLARDKSEARKDFDL